MSCLLISGEVILHCLDFEVPENPRGGLMLMSLPDCSVQHLSDTFSSVRRGSQDRELLEVGKSTHRYFPTLLLARSLQMNYFTKELPRNPLVSWCIVCLCKGASRARHTSEIGVFNLITLNRCFLGDSLSPFPFICDIYDLRSSPLKSPLFISLLSSVKLP